MSWTIRKPSNTKKKSELNHCSAKDVFLKKGKVINEEKKDVSENFINGALKAFDYAIKYQVEAAILKEKAQVVALDVYIMGILIQL